MHDTTLIVSQFFLLMLTAFVVAVFTRHIRVPYTLALVVTGLLIGIPHLIPHLRLEPGVLFTVFLPPLLFESAINLRAAALRHDWSPIVVFTLAGTVLSAFIVGALASELLGLPLGIAMVFGALISATDPIAVVAVSKRLGVGVRLATILESESLFNDAVAVVLFTVAMGAVAGTRISLAASVGSFLFLVAGGAAVGFAMGTLASKVHNEIDDHLIEITLTTIVAYGAYLGAPALNISGVTAVVVAGIVIGNHGLRAMSASTRLAVSAFWEYAAFATNSVVFLLVGVEVSYLNWSGHFLWGMMAALIVLLGRAVIYPLSFLVNKAGGDMPRSWGHILVWGGLRGALSMALALGLSPAMPFRNEILTATFGAVVFSLVIQSPTIGLLFRRLGLGGEHKHEAHHDYGQLAAEIVATHAALEELDRFRAAETHPSWAVELLARDYQGSLKNLEETIRLLESNHDSLAQKQALRAKGAALSAQKNALHEAALSGWIDNDDQRRILLRIDEELLALSGDKPE